MVLGLFCWPDVLLCEIQGGIIWNNENIHALLKTWIDVLWPQSWGQRHMRSPVKQFFSPNHAVFSKKVPKKELGVKIGSRPHPTYHFTQGPTSRGGGGEHFMGQELYPIKSVASCGMSFHTNNCSHASIVGVSLFLHPKLVAVLVAVLHGWTIEAIVLLCKTSKQSRKLWCNRIREMAWLMCLSA